MFWRRGFEGRSNKINNLPVALAAEKVTGTSVSIERQSHNRIAGAAWGHHRSDFERANSFALSIESDMRTVEFETVNKLC